MLLIVTDGEDNTSEISRDQVVKAAQQSGVLVYTIGILNEIGDAQTAQARREMDALTQATGGQAYYLNGISEADATARDIARDIRNQYTLAVHPRQSGTRRNLPQDSGEGPSRPGGTTDRANAQRLLCQWNGVRAGRSADSESVIFEKQC